MNSRADFRLPTSDFRHKTSDIRLLYIEGFDILYSLFDKNQLREKCLYVKRVRALRIAIGEPKI